MDKRYFSDKEIDKWNNILVKGNHSRMIAPPIDPKSKLKFLDRYSKTDIHAGRADDVVIKEFMKPNYSTFKYDFAFSVIKKRKKDFLILVDMLIEYGFEIGYDISKLFNIREEVYRNEEVEHKVYKNEMVKIRYSWDNPLIAMVVSTIIEDAIAFFELMWGYTEDGEEKCLVKYPIGNVVSKITDKHVDYMINGYEFGRPNTIINKLYPFTYVNASYEEFTILYEIVCIENDIKSPIIRYGASYVVTENEICPSRTNNLNIILN